MALSLLPAAVTLVAVAWIGRDLWFFSDDWNIFADYHSGGLLEPFNGHLSLVPAGIYRVLFATVGVDSYLPFRLAGLGSLAVLAFQVARLVHHRLADARLGRLPAAAVVGFLAGAAVLWNSAGQMNLMFPFLMNFTIPIAALAAIWWHLDRRTAPGDVAASLWLAVALATSGLGLMTALAVGVELLIGRAPLRRWAVLAPGPVLWVLWFLTHRDGTPLTTDVPAVAAYAARMLLAATSSIAAGTLAGGVLLAVVLLGYLVLAGVRWRAADGRLLGALAAPLAFAVFTAMTRIGIVPEIPPDELRYSWAVAAFLVLAAVVACRPRPLVGSSLPPAAPWALVGLAIVVLLAGSVRLVGDLQEWNARVRDARPGLGALLLATEAVGLERIDPDRVIPVSYVPVTTGGYLGAVEAIGSPVAGEEPVAGTGEPYALRTADEILVSELPVIVEPVPGPVAACAAPTRPDELEVVPGSVVELRDDPSVDVPPAEAGGLSRFGGAVEPVPLPLRERGPVRVSIPDDADGSTPVGLPYRLRVPEGTTAHVCG
jgi:hypothetical protein